MAAATADSASSSGTPAANSAPKVSSRMPRVIGRLSVSARWKSWLTTSPIDAVQRRVADLRRR